MSARAAALLGTLIALAWAPRACAQEGLQGAASVLLAVRGERPAPPSVMPAPPDTLALDARLRGVLGDRVGVIVGLDFTLGGAFRGGFVHALSLPVGLAARVGGQGYVALATGVGLSGVTSRVPESFDVPIELSTELDLERTLRLVFWTRVGWSVGDAVRTTPSVPWLDTLQVALGMRFGGSHAYDRADAGSGYVVALFYDERQGGRALGLALAFSMSGGTTRRPRRPDIPV